MAMDDDYTSKEEKKKENKLEFIKKLFCVQRNIISMLFWQ